MTGYFGEGDGYCLRYLFSDSLRFKIMSFSLLSFRIWGSDRSFAVNGVKIKDIHNNSKVGFDFFNIACPKPNQLLTRVYCQFQEISRKKMDDLVYGIDTHMKPEEHSSIKNLLMIPFQTYRPPVGSKFSDQ